MKILMMNEYEGEEEDIYKEKNLVDYKFKDEDDIVVNEIKTKKKKFKEMKEEDEDEDEILCLYKKIVNVISLIDRKGKK